MPARRVLWLALGVVLCAVPARAQFPSIEAGLLQNGRQLDPAGRLTPVGVFPRAGALTPDGRFYWAVDGGRGATAIRIVGVAGGEVVQVIPLPGGSSG